MMIHFEVEIKAKFSRIGSFALNFFFDIVDFFAD